MMAEVADCLDDRWERTLAMSVDADTNRHCDVEA